MKKTLLLSNHYEGTPLAILKKAVSDRFHLLVLTQADQKELYERIGEADYLLVSGRLKIDEEAIRRAGRLKMIQRTGVGLDNLDLECLKNHGIPLYVNRGVNAVSVAEHTVMLMLSTLKRSFHVNLQMRKGIWKKQATGLTTHELSGKNIGIIGMGSIGQAVARMLKGFDVNIYYYDVVRLDEALEKQLGITWAEFPALLGKADILSLHCGYKEETGFLITEKELALMPEGSILINTARGKLVKEKALIEVLESGHLSACGIDTYEMEPPSGITALAAFDQALLSPHIAGVSYEAFSRMMNQAVRNISCFDEGNLEAIKESRRI